MQIQHHTLSNDKSKQKLGYYASSNQTLMHAPFERLATLTPGHNILIPNEYISNTLPIIACIK